MQHASRSTRFHARPTTRLKYMTAWFLFLLLVTSFLLLATHMRFFRNHGHTDATPLGRQFRIRGTGDNLVSGRAQGFTNGHSAIVPGDPEVWGRRPVNSSATSALRESIGAETVQQLRSLCGRCLYRTLLSYVRVHDHGRFTIVLTGDIAAMWLRDSAVQMATYIPRVRRRPALRQVLEGAIRAQAYFILQVRVVATVTEHCAA